MIEENRDDIEKIDENIEEDGEESVLLFFKFLTLSLCYTIVDIVDGAEKEHERKKKNKKKKKKRKEMEENGDDIGKVDEHREEDGEESILLF